MRESLTPDLVLEAYAHGFFPMAESRDGPIGWHSPDPRGILPLDHFHIPRSLRRIIRGGLFQVRMDTSFRRVVEQCALREETWISGEIVRVYCELHSLEYAHSVETWQEDALVGGLYGVAIGGAFFGESMFSLVPNASKVALAALVEILRGGGFVLLDTQFVTDHLKMFGACDVTRTQYLTLLQSALQKDSRWLLESPPGPWMFTHTGVTKRTPKSRSM